MVEGPSEVSCSCRLDVCERAAYGGQYKQQCGSPGPGLGAGQRGEGLLFGAVMTEVIFRAVGMTLVLG